ncbi:MAG TPA: hypothetical protein VMU32_01860 [Solirubrobacteraceae bacterium]|nr:hypothetical protein [Solirubrobacteraceae bacterium]
MAKDKDAKDKGNGKGKKSKGEGKATKDKGAPDASEAAGPGLSLAAHPRAARRVAEAKAWGALGGFLLGGYLSLATHSPFETALRALIAGAVCYVAVWAVAVFLWRRLIVAELRHAEHELLSRRLARMQGAASAAEPAGALAGQSRAAGSSSSGA